MKHWVFGLAGAGLIWMSYGFTSIRPEVNPTLKTVGLSAHDTHAAASLIGQFRTSLSSSLYLRADLYLHNGVEMRPLSDLELKAGRKGVGSSEAEQYKLHDDSKIVTIIPPKDRDFRGLFGDVERSIASYKDMTGHSHQTPTRTLPLFRLMTWLDPQFIQGWTTGGFVLLWDQKPGCFDKSIEFLKEGLKANPQSIDILTQIAYCYLKVLPEAHKNEREYLKALPYILEARNVGVKNLKVLNQQELAAFRENYWRMALCFREIGDYKQMLRAAEEGASVFTEDYPLKRHVTEAKRLLAGEKIVDRSVVISDPEGLEH